MHQLERFDFGAIFLPGAGLPKCGALGFAAAPDDLLGGRALNIAGYPLSPGRAKYQYFHGRYAKSLEPSFIEYETDTSGGQSGSPVWIQHQGKRFAVGIHTAGGPAGNRAVRIDPDVFHRLRVWKDRGNRG